MSKITATDAITAGLGTLLMLTASAISCLHIYAITSVINTRVYTAHMFTGAKILQISAYTLVNIKPVSNLSTLAFFPADTSLPIHMLINLRKP